ncbi:MAG: cytochrome C oxidase subunit II [Bacteroidetes bacterium GWE2_41_25]|nr:MAG: cytochrome C oxidase subunit II [Bacteroidetes bacterium GWA2_40_15]OFX91742.1 MAG: cytochrome C oxidase subunit II [Bacteroidetes bacterium GWC2_40_22]OFY10815.1 MAG: cytochrome C oxidase subunit II [Bacteroidetes bacterium GWE2_41_25]HAM11008.1 cytochrome ubiquinol oxidase subunit I [Bacteroidales bacterium]HBH84613.1 cytochrome ubiquinol oxidase subunit I [Bacteroidales bacterium]
MIENVDLSLLNWSRAQFALTAIYHWLFVPLTLGLSFLVAIMETIYVRTGNEEWKRITRFWMTLFGVNFAIGVATGIILEFEFGTNWSNYSWFVGDIFGAPLAIEGIVAFFLESTFIAVMFFGWNKVSRKFHLVSTWLVAIGSNLSALWILVANGWMQNPVGMVFNPETARNEMVNFWAVIFNQVSVDKFLHTLSSSYLLGSMFVLSISSWFLIRKREGFMARRSILVASVFGLLASLMTAYTGDESARIISKVQPVKFAAMEALAEGKTNAGLVAFGVLKDSDRKLGEKPLKDFLFKIEIPSLLSVMTAGNKEAFVPGISDFVDGNKEQSIMSFAEKKERGQVARRALIDYKSAVKNGNIALSDSVKGLFSDKAFQDNYFRYFGYASIDKPEDIIPDVSGTFYSFHLMVILGFLFIFLFGFAVYLLFKGTIADNKWFLWICLLSLPLPYIASELGWIVAELGRQPWIIQDLMPVSTAVTDIGSGTVMATFFMFAALFTTLLISEISIMVKQIKKGPKH